MITVLTVKLTSKQIPQLLEVCNTDLRSLNMYT